MKSSSPRIILAVLLLLVVSCSKEVSKETGHGTTPAQGNFYATIDGNHWDADSLQFIQVGNNGVIINGLSKTGIEISMVLPVFKTGTYTLNASSIPFALYVNLLVSLTDVFYTNVGSATGTVTISSIDTVNHLVSGSFQFTLVNPSDNSTKTVTSGIFSYIPYSGGTVPIPPGGTAVDTLKASADGTLFTSVQITSSTNNGQLVIAGITLNGATLALFMPDTVAVGSYNFDFGTGDYIGVYNPPGT